ncbi:MAG: glycosyltransferase family A protein [Bryobacteraceae bacterium]
MILTTRDRPNLFRIALACYRNQTYSSRQLIVVDDGDTFPVAERDVAECGGRLIRVSPGSMLGTKLNVGAAEASGLLCQKTDDDDWYAPEFLETMVSTLAKDGRKVCRPSLLFVSPFLFFDVARWEIRESLNRNAPGATLMFARENWQAKPFRNLPQDEDVWFFQDQIGMGVNPLAVIKSEIFLAVRHQGAPRDRAHTWTHQSDGRTMEEYLQQRPITCRPEDLIPQSAIASYRTLRSEILTATSNDEFVSP